MNTIYNVKYNQKDKEGCDVDKKNMLDQIPLAQLGEGELEKIKELEDKISEKKDSKIYLMALEEDRK